MGDFYDWSETASSNGAADSNINFAEFQNPDTVNDSARALMARLAAWRKDNAPTRSSSGTGNAYEVTSQAGGTSTYRDGEIVVLIANRANTDACTLNVNARGAKPFRPASGVAFRAGEIQANQPLIAFYRQSSDEWLALGTGYHVNAMTSGMLAQSVGARLLKIGMPVLSIAPSAPAGYIRLTEATQTLNKADWPELSAWLAGLSSPYPWGSAATTFNLPPAAGYVLRFAATSSAIDTGGARAAGSTQADQVRAHTHTFSGAGTTNVTGDHTHSVTGASSAISGSTGLARAEAASQTTSAAGAHQHTVTVSGTTDSTGADEVRVKNVAMHVDIFASSQLSAGSIGMFGFPYTWDSSTAAGDPGTARVRANNATLGSITALYINQTDVWGVNLETLLASINASSILRLSKMGAQSNTLVVRVTGTIVDNGSYFTIPCNVLAASGSFTNNDSMAFEISGGAGTAGATGATAPAPLDFTWNTGTASADPGVGNIRANNANLSAATQIYINEIDRLNVNVANFLDDIGMSTSTIKGHLFLVDLATPANRVYFRITGPIVDNGSWKTIPVAYRSGVTSLSAVNVSMLPLGRGDIGTSSSHVANVMDYGAVADGATDSTAAFTAALATGKPVYVPFSTTGYVVGSITLSSHQHIFTDPPEGRGFCKLIAKSGTADWFCFGGSYASVANFWLNANAATGAAFRIKTSTGGKEWCTVQTCYVQFSTIGVADDNHGTNKHSKTVLTEVTFAQPNGRCIEFYDTQGFIFLDQCWYDMSSTTTNAAAVFVDDNEGLFISDNFALGTYSDATPLTSQHGYHLVNCIGVWITNSDADTMGGKGWLLDHCWNVLADGASANICGGTGIEITAASGTCENIMWRGAVKGRVAAGGTPPTSDGIKIDATAAAISDIMLDVNIDEATGDGLDLTSVTNIMGQVSSHLNTGFGVRETGTSTGLLYVGLRGNTAGDTSIASGNFKVFGRGNAGFLSGPFAPATTGTAIQKANGSGGFSAAVAGTDYQAPLGYTPINKAGDSGISTLSMTLGQRVDLYLSGAAKTGFQANSGSGNLEIYASSSGALRLFVDYTNGTLGPAADNSQTLGNGSFRWSTVYAGTGTINTSDGTQKTVRGELTAQELAAWGDVRWCVYRWNDALEQKGDNARMHAGLIAQDIERCFAAHGLDARRYALFCEDEEFERIVLGKDEETGLDLTEVRPTGRKRLGLRYDQCQAFEAAYVRASIGDRDSGRRWVERLEEAGEVMGGGAAGLSPEQCRQRFPLIAAGVGIIGVDMDAVAAAVLAEQDRWASSQYEAERARLLREREAA